MNEGPEDIFAKYKRIQLSLKDSKSFKLGLFRFIQVRSVYFFKVSNSTGTLQLRKNNIRAPFFYFEKHHCHFEIVKNNRIVELTGNMSDNMGG